MQLDGKFQNRKTIKVRDAKHKARFIYHEPCPKCGSRDNVGVYDDGSKYCFGCEDYLPPQRSLDNTHQTQREADLPDWEGYEFTIQIPPQALTWLRAYQITDQEIEFYALMWEKKMSLLVFPVWNEDGEMVGFNGRCFNQLSKHDKYNPKYIHVGSKDELPVYTSDEDNSNTVIFVEDPVSAIKVGRQYNAIPLFGSNMDSKAIIRAASRFNSVGIWLDRDMARKSFLECSRASLFLETNGLDSRIFEVRSEFDPKMYSPAQIRQFIEIAKGSV